MIDFFAGLYEWWGFNPLYDADLGDYLRGLDITCSVFSATPWYSYVGMAMFTITGFFYVLQYYIIDSPLFNKRVHWWIVALVIVGLNYSIAFSISFNSLPPENHCSDLTYRTADCFGFGLSNAIWSFIVFIVITSIPSWVKKKYSNNCCYTRFWKPKSNN